LKIGERGEHNMYMDVYTMVKKNLGIPFQKDSKTSRSNM